MGKTDDLMSVFSRRTVARSDHELRIARLRAESHSCLMWAWGIWEIERGISRGMWFGATTASSNDGSQTIAG